MRVIHAPDQSWQYLKDHNIVFLAGSIEMGAAVDWQADVIARIEAWPDSERLVVLNPRRPDWDPSWEQDISNPQFRQQVEWELDGIEHADLVLMYFDPATKSPITLLELGFIAGRDQFCTVCCPPGFWRRGNVQIVCARAGGNLVLVDSIDEMIALIFGVCLL